MRDVKIDLLHETIDTENATEDDITYNPKPYRSYYRKYCVLILTVISLILISSLCIMILGPKSM